MRRTRTWGSECRDRDNRPMRTLGQRTAWLLAAVLGLLLAIVLMGGRDGEEGELGDAKRNARRLAGPLSVPTSTEQAPRLAGAAGATAVRGAQVVPPPPEAAQAPLTCRVFGRVIGPAGMSTAGARVVSLDRSGGVLAELGVAPDGSFDGEHHLPRGSRVVQWSARLQQGRDAWASVLATRTVGPGQEVGLVLYLQAASSIRARAMLPDGSPARQARFLLSERPSMPAERVPTWEVDTVEPSVQTISCDEQGRIDVPVRPGRVHLRVCSEEGLWGEARLFDADPHQAIDAGAFEVPDANVPSAGRIVDAVTGEPVRGAWIQLDGDLARWDDEVGPLPTLHARDDGGFDIEYLGSDALPLRAAVGSPRHHPRDVVFTDRGAGLLIELQPLPVLRIRVVHPFLDSEALKAALADAAWSIRSKSPAASPSAPDDPPIAQMAALMAYTSPRVSPGTEPGEFVTHLPSSGEYKVRLSLPGTSLSEGTTWVSGNQPAQVTLALPKGPVVRLRVSAPPNSMDALATTKNWIVGWLASNGDLLAEGDLRDLGQALDREVLLLGPPGAAQLELRLREPSSAPYDPVHVVLSREDDQPHVVAMAPRGPLYPVAFQMTLRDEDVPLGNASVWVLPSGAVRGMHVTTSESGLAQAWLASGAYRAVSLRRFGEPRWTSFVVGDDGDAPVTARLPVDP